MIIYTPDRGSYATHAEFAVASMQSIVERGDKSQASLVERIQMQGLTRAFSWDGEEALVLAHCRALALDALDAIEGHEERGVTIQQVLTALYQGMVKQLVHQGHSSYSASSTSRASNLSDLCKAQAYATLAQEFESVLSAIEYYERRALQLDRLNASHVYQSIASRDKTTCLTVAVMAEVKSRPGSAKYTTDVEAVMAPLERFVKKSVAEGNDFSSVPAAYSSYHNSK